MLVKEMADLESMTNDRILDFDFARPMANVDGVNLYQFDDSDPTGLVDPSGLAPTTQPTTQAAPPELLQDTKPTQNNQPTSPPPPVQVIVYKGSPFIVFVYHGKGVPTYNQIVTIVPAPGNIVPPEVVAQEKDTEHGGKDPFKGYVPDNDCPPPNTVYNGGKSKTGSDPNNPRRMTDAPNFKIYPKDFSGTKYLVTWVLDPDGHIVSVVFWHVTDTNGKESGPIVDLQIPYPLGTN